MFRGHGLAYMFVCSPLLSISLCGAVRCGAATIPDTVRRGLMDALGEHLKALRLHWLANVKDAVRLNQVGWVGGWLAR